MTTHKENPAQYARERYFQRRQAGLCAQCPEKALRGTSHCQRHTDANRLAFRRSQLERACANVLESLRKYLR